MIDLQLFDSRLGAFFPMDEDLQAFYDGFQNAKIGKPAFITVKDESVAVVNEGRKSLCDHFSVIDRYANLCFANFERESKSCNHNIYKDSVISGRWAKKASNFDSDLKCDKFVLYFTSVPPIFKYPYWPYFHCRISSNLLLSSFYLGNRILGKTNVFLHLFHVSLPFLEMKLPPYVVEMLFNKVFLFEIDNRIKQLDSTFPFDVEGAEFQEQFEDLLNQRFHFEKIETIYKLQRTIQKIKR